MTPEEMALQINKGLTQELKKAKEHLKEVENFLEYLGDNWPQLPGETDEIVSE